MDCDQVPKKYFEYFLGTINVQANSVREVCHKRQPRYQATTRKISYKIFDAQYFFNAFEESNIHLNTEVLFAGSLSIEEDDDALVSAEKLIAKAKQRVHTTGQKRKRPSSKSTLIVGYGEGRTTREVEIIWWPDLYDLTDHGRMVIRFFIEKCVF